MKAQVLAALVAVFGLVGCDSNRNQVQDAQRELGETRQEATQNVKEAQGEAVRDINEAKESAASEIKDARSDVQEAQRDAARGTASGTTSGATTGTVNVTPEQCAQFATNRTVSPDQQALYDACAQMDPEKFRRQ